MLSIVPGAGFCGQRGGTKRRERHKPQQSGRQAPAPPNTSPHNAAPHNTPNQAPTPPNTSPHNAGTSNASPPNPATHNTHNTHSDLLPREQAPFS
jgi:hypothetical protein